MPSMAPARLQIDGCTKLLMGDLLTRVLLTADVDNMHKDIRTREPGCHIRTLTAATWLDWPLRVFGSSLRMPAVPRPAVGRPGVGMPDQGFPRVLIKESLITFFFRGLMGWGRIKGPDKMENPFRKNLIGACPLCRFFCANNKPAFGLLRFRP